jgi:DNA recombination protein RmuC
MQPVWILLAATVGGVLGFWLAKSSLERRNRELSTDLSESKDALAKAKSESESRAGFEALATERQGAIGRLEEERGALREELRAKSETERDQAARVSKLEAELNSERQNLAEKLALLESAKQTLAHQFEALAGEILEKKSKSFSEGSQKELGTLLTPLKSQIEEFRKKVEEAQTDSKTGVTKLETLIGTLGILNQQLSEEAHNLTTALRGSSKAQGIWGEDIARDLLELGGLREGVQFRMQKSFDAPEINEESSRRRARPDVIVSLPGGRTLIIDSKVSLKDYTDSVNAGDENQRSEALKRHLESIYRHIDGLAGREYQKIEGLESPDFVVMFIPIEPAFLLAIHKDSQLWRYAYENHVLLVGPTTLLFVIRIVDNLWQQELQARSVKDVMDRGTMLYEKFVGFIDDLEEIGKSLHGASQSYEEARKKLSEGRGNLVFQVEELRKLGVKRKAQIGAGRKTQKTIPLKWLASAGVEEEDEEETGLVLAAEAEEIPSTEGKPNEPA